MEPGAALPEMVPEVRVDFGRGGIRDWTVVAGAWTVQELAGTTSGRPALVERTNGNVFNVIVAPPGPFTDVEVSVRFQPISGRIDAAGGIVFRFHGARYRGGRVGLWTKADSETAFDDLRIRGR